MKGAIPQLAKGTSSLHVRVLKPNASRVHHLTCRAGPPAPSAFMSGALGKESPQDDEPSTDLSREGIGERPSVAFKVMENRDAMDSDMVEDLAFAMEELTLESSKATTQSLSIKSQGDILPTGAQVRHDGPARGYGDVRSTEPLSSSSGMRVFDDSIPSMLQPRNPMYLPGFRHQSRIEWNSAHRPSRRVTIQAPNPFPVSPGFILRRESSPTGLTSPGFRGLYGGWENSDEVALGHDP
ncbi:hypothetical protein HIM_08603 [Hirsutella minnesotensis 3608]|uniref:Uncharacterized protein n=1 Tax=Hirsutella minnesotensis 3608 TaxID=1043627 RepID=A0A0F7ZY87_9HYPO|nr:hypothetical protein HIM_08603 [Hirsutella minnesotensis 3608]